MSDAKKPFSYDEFKSIYSKIPRLTVEVIIKSKRGILLTKRIINPHKNMWCLPGGTVYFKETIEEATKRVAKEELGLEIHIEKRLGVIEYLQEELFGGFDHPVGIAMLCSSVSDMITLDFSAGEAEYFSLIPENTVEEQKEFLLRELF